LKNLLKEKQGTTLVEMIVSFLLLVIFMSCTVGIVTSSMKLYSRNVSMNRAQSLADLILSDIKGEIENASSELEYNENVIAFRNENMDREIIYLHTNSKGDQELRIHYDEVRNEIGIESKAVNWYYDTTNYMGNTIKKLTFDKISTGDDEALAFKVTIRLKNKTTQYEYEDSTIVECYFTEGELKSSADSNMMNSNIKCTCEEDAHVTISNP
jgi:hypothetical protein